MELRDFGGHGIFFSNSLALFVDTELTEFHGTDFLGVGKEEMEHCTGIHRRCAHGCATERTERGPIADAAPCQREYGDRKMRSLHGGQRGCYGWN